MKSYTFFSDQVSAAAREKIEKAGGRCIQDYDEDSGYTSPFVWIYLPDETRTMSYGYLLPGDVPLYVDAHYEIDHALQGDVRVIIRSLR